MSKRKAAIEKAKQRDKHKARLRAEGRQLLKWLNCEPLLEPLSSRVRDYILTFRLPPMQFVADESVKNEDVLAQLPATSKHLSNVDAVNIHFASDASQIEGAITLQQFWQAVTGMYVACKAVVFVKNQAEADHVDQLRQALGRQITEAWRSADKRLSMFFVYLSNTWSRHDRALYTFRENFPRHLNSFSTDTITVKAVVPPIRRFNIDGEERDCFPIGAGGANGTIKWVELDGSLFGQSGQMPVYMIRHALRRLRSRLPELNEGTIEGSLVLSLVEPKVVHYGGVGHAPHWLIEFNIRSHKLGYVGVHLCEGCLIIRTFLFLTMAGTPEGDRLYQLLRLSMHEREYHRLTSLRTFVESDLFDDPVIGEALRASGCGSLAEIRMLVRGTVPDLPTSFAAEELKKYLRLDEHRTEVLKQRIENLKEQVEC